MCIYGALEISEWPREKSVTFPTICPSHAPSINYKKALRKTKSENFKPCPDYIFRTASKYKRKFTPNFTVSLFTFSLSLLSQIPNYKNPTKIGTGVVIRG